jgi:hypothetical protein
MLENETFMNAMSSPTPSSRGKWTPEEVFVSKKCLNYYIPHDADFFIFARTRFCEMPSKLIAGVTGRRFLTY